MTTPKHRYCGLDGLRGLAALAVVLLHQRSWCAPGVFAWLMPRGYLAVDFFLLLSGFVVAHAYGDRLETRADVLAMLRARVVRLHPLIALGVVLGALCLPFYTGPAAVAPAERFAVELAALGPLPTFGHGSTIPANFALWSLTWELVLSAAFALLARHLTSARLVAAALAGALLTGGLALAHGNLDVGSRPETFWVSGVRLTTSFVLGILVLRAHRAGVLAGGGARRWIAPALVASFLPLAPAATMDPLIALVAYPVMLLAAAGAAPSRARVDAWLGTLSYPLYAIHGPLVLALHGWEGDRPTTLGEVLALTAALIPLAWAAHRFYDVPLRRWLTDALAPRRRVAAAARAG